ncbi:collagen alpha-1(I) chain-like isoform X2 [Amphibalanus amphitrite]|uniref:collagen alpha-1(I) chain-like isoform X2 n=1 Tax=Amphibalanus amphitrite TaxID=1232801 RepID=UPI001C90FDAB|nr:collagen alpha-1(I) chain-like isoform X2 [Amphibalanus amphitrite]
MKMKNNNADPTLSFEELAQHKVTSGGASEHSTGGRPVYQCPPLPPRMRHKPPPPAQIASGHAEESELGVYKSVPPPRQLGEQPVTNGAAPGRLSGSDPMLASQEIQLHSSKFPVERQTTGSRDQLLQSSASLGDGIDNPAMEDPYGVYRGPGRASGRGQPEYAPGPAAAGASGSDTLRDACSRMFQRDGWGRGSQSVRAPQPTAGMSAQAPRSAADGPTPASGADPTEGDQERAKNGTLTKKYYHIKDMISNRLGKLGADQTGRPAPAAAPAQNNAVNGRASNINSSFRKAMQHNAQKSNLTDESGVLYSMSSLSLESGAQPGYTPPSGGPLGAPYGYTGGFGAGPQSRLGQPPPPPAAHPGHPQYGGAPGYGAPASEHAPGAAQYGPGAAGAIYGTAAQPGGAPWQQQRPLPPQPYPGPPPRPAVYGSTPPRPAHGAHPLRPAAPPAYGTHQPSGPHFNGHPLSGQPLYGQLPAAAHFNGQHPAGPTYGGTQPAGPTYGGGQPAGPTYSGSQTSAAHFSSSQTSTAHYSSPQTSAAQFNGPPTSAAQFNGPPTSVSQFNGPPTSAPQLGGPPTSVPQFSGAQTPAFSSQQTSTANGSAGGPQQTPGRQDSPARPAAEGVYGQTAAPPAQRPPPPPASPPPAEDPQPAAAAEPAYASRQEAQKEGGLGHSSDSGHGSSQSAGGERPQKMASPAPLDSSLDSDVQSSRQKQAMAAALQAGHSSGNDSEWVDMVETELRQILDPRLFRSTGAGGPAPGPGSGSGGGGGGGTPPLPALPLGDSPAGSQSGSPSPARQSVGVGGGGLSQPDLLEAMSSGGGGGGGGGDGGPAVRRSGSSGQGRAWPGRAQEVPLTREPRDMRSRHRIPLNTRLASVSSAGRTDGDVTSMTTGLDLESMLDATTDQTTDDESTVLEATADGPAIRKQLESLEGMYSEVLRLLGGGQRRVPPGARLPRSGLTKHRMYGSMSSLPSSIGARPVKERRRDDRKKLKDMKGVNKRFQRLESHVVTLARSVAHLSSEMRTQHLMFQELESIRTELTQLRTSPGRALRPHRPANEFEAFRDAVPSLTHPGRVRKLTKFFGDEPPLLRIFLKKLGYEKYAALFERERIGMIELPYMTEDRLQKLGIPIGPRLRILQEAQMSLRNDNFNVYIL